MSIGSKSAKARGIVAVVVAAVALATTACSTTSPSSSAAASGGRIVAVGAENEYADLIGQIGGPYVDTTAILSNPNTDPHTFESSPSVAQVVGSAHLVVQNGLGYDAFMNKIESAAPDPTRRVIDVQTLLGLPDSTANPHLWYRIASMPVVAQAIGKDLASLAPAHAGYFHAAVARFDASLAPLYAAIASLRAADAGAPVATTEPVADYLLEAAGLDNRTPLSFQADIMNGVDPSPEDESIQIGLFTHRQVKVFVYNQQVTDSLTEVLLSLALRNHIPVVGVYETMPTPGYDYQSWMVAEVHALRNALAHGTSAPRL